MSELVEGYEDFEMAINKLVEEQQGLNNSVYSPPVKNETDLEQATSFLKVLHHENEGMFEVCIHLREKPKEWSGIYGAWFKDYNWAAQHFIDCWGENSKKVYTTFNPVNEAKGKTQLVWGSLCTRTSDKDIDRLDWVFIDLDPIKEGGAANATNAEKQLAHIAMKEVDEWLTSVGLSQMIVGDSGNGYSMLIPIRMPRNDETVKIIPKFLSLISTLCQNRKLKVDIDTSVSNPARLCPLFPTMACKGKSTPDRPHRKSAILRLPKVENLTPEVKEANTAIIKSMVEDDIRANPPPKRESSTPIAVDVDDLTKLERCLLYVAKMPDSIQGQKGRPALWKVAWKAAVDFDLDYDTTLYILDVYNDRAIPPWLYRDLEVFANNAVNKKPDFPERIGCKLIENVADYNWSDDVPEINFSLDDEIGGAA